MFQTKEKFKNEQDECERKIKQWYWASVFGERYSKGVEGTKTADFRDMLAWFEDDSKTPKFIIDFTENYKRRVSQDS